jgi:hypothetical protein
MDIQVLKWKKLRDKERSIWVGVASRKRVTIVQLAKKTSFDHNQRAISYDEYCLQY